MSASYIYEAWADGPKGRAHVTAKNNGDGTFSVRVDRAGRAVAGAVRNSAGKAKSVAKSYRQNVEDGDL